MALLTPQPYRLIGDWRRGIRPSRLIPRPGPPAVTRVRIPLQENCIGDRWTCSDRASALQQIDRFTKVHGGEQEGLGPLLHRSEVYVCHIL